MWLYIQYTRGENECEKFIPPNCLLSDSLEYLKFPQLVYIYDNYDICSF